MFHLACPAFIPANCTGNTIRSEKLEKMAKKSLTASRDGERRGSRW
jgi:hypothetical protein